MSEIRHVPASIPLEPGQPEGVTVLEGDPAGRGFLIHESAEPGLRAAGIFECEPSKTTFLLEQNEIIYVIQGEATIELDNGSRIDLSAGDMAHLPAGHVSTWTFHSTYREFWLYAD